MNELKQEFRRIFTLHCSTAVQKIKYKNNGTNLIRTDMSILDIISTFCESLERSGKSMNKYNIFTRVEGRCSPHICLTADKLKIETVGLLITPQKSTFNCTDGI